MRFQVFSFASKKVQRFFSERKILKSLWSVLFHLQNHVSVFWNFDFEPKYFGKRPRCPWKQPYFLRNSIKVFYLPNKTILNKSEKRFCRRKTAEDSLFLQVFFPRNVLFRQVLRTSVFPSGKYLKTSNKRTRIPLFVKQFVSLIEQDVAIDKLLT